jgi:Ca-activated chloride channel homolog
MKSQSICWIACRTKTWRPLIEEKAVLFAFFCLCAFFLCKTGNASAQDTPEVHVVLRRRGIGFSSAATSSSNVIFRSSADLVLVNAMVTDSLDRLVTGMEKSNFAIYQDKQLQTISSLSNEDAPVSIGVILDTSGSMRDKMTKAIDAVNSFLETANLEDEFSVISFSDEPRLISAFTSNASNIENKLMFLQAKGETALLDAIYLGISQMRNAKFQRKALLIVSDGGDNHSRYTESEVKELAKEADTQIFALGIFDRYVSTLEESLGPELLSEISEITGGKAFTIENPNDLADVARKVSVALRDEYVLAYVPKPQPQDGRWHKIKLKLLLPKDIWLSASWTMGYYAIR